MKNKIPKIYESIINSGTVYGHSLVEKRRIRIINILYLISIFSAQTFCMFYLLIDKSLLFPLIVNANIFTIIYILGIVLVKYNKLKISQHLLCLSLTGVTTVTAFFQVGVSTSTHFYFLLFAVAPLLVWELSQLKHILFYFLLNTILFVFANFILDQNSANIIFPRTEAYFISIFTVFSTFFSLLIVLWINLKHIEENEAKLNKQSIKLDSLNEELSLKNIDLQDLNATKDKFFSIIAHDLRNHIGDFKKVTSLLHENYEDFERKDRIEFLELMKYSSNNLYKLMENLLEWSRSQQGQLDFAPIEINIHSLVNGVVELFSLSLQNKDIKISNLIDKDLVCTVDPNLTQTIFRNLISNAIKFTPNGGNIEVGFLKRIESLVDIKNDLNQFYIRDTGVGMNTKSIQKLFRIDENVSTIGTNNERGSGLGLILCKEFVEKHAGKIWAESKEGKGSTFFFTLQNTY